MLASLKDGASLLLAAALVATGAWAFWHYLGEEAGPVFGLIMLLVFAIDNYRLRRRLRALERLK